MSRNVGHRNVLADYLAGHAPSLLGVALLLGLVGLPAVGLAQDAVTAAQQVEYRDIPYIGSEGLGCREKYAACIQRSGFVACWCRGGGG